MKIVKSIFLAAVAVVGMSMASCGSKAEGDKADSNKADTEAVSTNKVATIIDFNATWCGPCKMFAPIFEAAAEKYTGKVEFKSVDIDAEPEQAGKYGVEAIPTIVLLDAEGNVLEQYVGFLEAPDFEQLIEKYL